MLAHPATVERVANSPARAFSPTSSLTRSSSSTSGDVLMGEGGVEAYRDGSLPTRRGRDAQSARGGGALRRRRRRREELDDVSDLARAFSSSVRPTCSSRADTSTGGATSRALRRSTRESRRPPRARRATRSTPRNDHGTGCSLSSAIAAGLALGRSVPDATRDAKSFVLAALEGAADWHSARGAVRSTT